MVTSYILPIVLLSITINEFIICTTQAIVEMIVNSLTILYKWMILKRQILQSLLKRVSGSIVPHYYAESAISIGNLAVRLGFIRFI